VKFTYKSNLPILEKEIRYSNLTCAHYIEILKYIQSNDDNGLINYFEWLIEDLSTDKKYIKQLTNIEKFIILLDIRAVSVSSSLQLKGINDSKIDMNISIIKNNIYNNIKKLNLKKIINSSEIIVNLKSPKSFIIDNIDSIYQEVIDIIQIGDEAVNFFLLSNEEKEDIISSLPANISTEIVNFVKNIQDDSSEMKIIAENLKLGYDAVPLNLFDKTMFYFLKAIFNDDLHSFYELQFNMIHKMHFSYDHIQKMTPSECKLFINFYNKEMKRQEEAQSKSNGSMPSMPSMPRYK
jgi:hypothetical protein